MTARWRAFYRHIYPAEERRLVQWQIICYAIKALETRRPHETFPDITANDFAAYQTRGDQRFGIWMNALALYGFWNDEYILPKDTFTPWPLAALAILALSAAGGYTLIKKREPLGITLILIFLPALALGVGYGSSAARLLTAAFAEWLPGFRGLRETEKLLGLLALTYALLAPLGLAWIARQFGRAVPAYYRYISGAACILLCLLVPVHMHSIFWGFSGQLTPSSYPVSWERAREILARDPGTRAVLFLPWHGYMAFSFSGAHRISNPAPRYFDATIIAARSVDNSFLLARDQNDWDRALFRLVQRVSRPEDEIALLRAQQVTHIILAQGTDWERYGFLDASPLFTPIFSSPDLTLYRVQ